MNASPKDRFESHHYEIAERRLRSEVLKQWAIRLNELAERIEKEPAAALDPTAREGRIGLPSDGRLSQYGLIGLLDPNLRVLLDGGKVLGLQVPLLDLEKFLDDQDAFNKILNSHLHASDQRDTLEPAVWVQAILQKDRVLIKDILQEKKRDKLNRAIDAVEGTAKRLGLPPKNSLVAARRRSIRPGQE